MITMLQYSVGYRYALNNRKTNSTRKASVVNNLDKVYKTAEKENISRQNFLNKTNNKEVIDFMKEVAGNVNTFKTALSGLSTDIKYIKKFKTFDDEDEKLIEEDLEKLTSSLNKIGNIIDKNKDKTNTKKMESFEKRIFDNYEKYKKDFEKLGIKYVDGKFKKDKKMDSDYFIKNIDSFQDKISSLNEETNKFLDVPMTEFVQFKNLNFYVNYSFKNKYSDTFKLIESGSLLNVIV